MHDHLMNLKNQALARATQATSTKELDELRIEYLGKSGELAKLASKLKDLSVEEKKVIGPLFNDVKQALESIFLSSPAASSSQTEINTSLPGIKPPIGHLHPVTSAIDEISTIFEQIGFTRMRYPEVEYDWFAFEALNMDSDHPARDEWETFFVDAPQDPKFGKMVLTPHTSSGQPREMIRLQNPPIRMINIAKCYRRQSDLTHTVMFHQFEGLVVDENINITHLKGTIDYFVQKFFGPNRKSRLRPYHFQFTEPSFEVDVTPDESDPEMMKMTKDGWLELGGAGMVHPNVLKAAGIDPEKYTGFAFGWGVERTYMMKSGLKIPDLRLMYSNDVRFLHQF